MPKVYYGKDSITPSFLQPKDSNSELFRTQIAKDSLRQTEESSLENILDHSNDSSLAETLEQKPF